MHLILDLNTASTALYDRDPFMSPQARLCLGNRRLRLTIKSLLTIFLRILKEKAVPQCFDLSRTVRYNPPTLTPWLNSIKLFVLLITEEEEARTSFTTSCSLV